MRTNVSRAVLASLGGVVGLVSVSGAAWAVSGGNYRPDQQDCTPAASANNAPIHTTQRGCHTVAINVTDGNGRRYGEFGLDQLPSGYPGTPGLLSLGYPGQPNAIHSGCIGANTNGTNGGTGRGCGTGTGTGFELNFDTQHPGNNSLTTATGTPDVGALIAALGRGMTLSIGADDNTDAGEHDGVSGKSGTSGVVNGPSDGGGGSVSVSPGRATAVPSLTDPLPAAAGQLGFCADGICTQTTTRRQALYHGCGANTQVPCRAKSRKARNAYDYSTKSWDPYNCSSGDSTSEAPGPSGCGGKTMNEWRAAEAQTVYAQPGFQIYEDPDPQGSPAGPLYPLPAVYVGTCGVALGGGALQVPASPFTNSAGQLIIPTGC